MKNTEFLTVAEATAHWRVGHTTVLGWIRRGERVRAAPEICTGAGRLDLYLMHRV